MKNIIYRNILIIVLIVSLLLVGVENLGASTGNIVEGSSPSKVVVFKSIALDFTPQLKEGVIFDDIKFLPVTNVNAKHNYNGFGNTTQYAVLISADSNSPADLCVKADGPLTTVGGDSIPLSGETYSFSQISSLTIPELALETPFTTNYTTLYSNLPIGGIGYMRFFLDVDSGQASGDYKNNLYFKGSAAGTGC